jgi:glycosyltransferase involved in cell wall biosynthesis
MSRSGCPGRLQQNKTAARIAAFGTLLDLEDPSPRKGGSWLYGAWVANARLLRELLREGLAQALDYFAPTGRVRSTNVLGRRCRELPFTDFAAESRARPYDLLLAFFGWNSGVPSVRARYLPRASLVQVVHSMHYERTLWDLGCHLIWELFEPYDAIVCSSPTAVRTLQNMLAHWEEQSLPLRGRRVTFPGRIVQIPLGTDLPAEMPQRAAARAQLGWDLEERTILVVGRLSSFDKMDCAVLLPVLRNLLGKSRRPLRLVIAGEDSRGEARRLRQVAGGLGLSEHLRVYSNIRYDTRSQLYAAADVFLSLADHIQETFGLTILEAMAHGLPVVASDWGGYRDLVDPGRTGFLVPTLWGGRVGDYGAVASIDSMTSAYCLARRTAVDVAAAESFLLELVRNDHLASVMGRAGRRRIRQRYTWTHVIAQYQSLWSELAELRRRAPSAPRTAVPPRGHDYWRLFGHYPTRRLALSDHVSARMSVREALHTNPVFLLSVEEEQLAIRTILRVLAGQPQTVESCVDCVSESLSLPREKVEDHLLLAAKYGLVELRPQQSPAGP